MKKLEDILIPPSASLMEAIGRIDSGAMQIALVTDGNGRLLGAVTDGDIRRGLLRGLSLEAPVREVMNASPVTLPETAGRGAALALMREKGIHAIPLLDEQGRLAGMETETALLFTGQRDTCVVLMAGGLGMRLRPLTEDTPKPMLKVRGKPMLEHIIGRFRAQGFRRFYLCVNYRAEMIEAHFGDGSALDCDIRYVREEKPLGTGGALALLDRAELSRDLIVMNGDLLTTVNFRSLLAYHRANACQATMCAISHKVDIPFGVVEVKDGVFAGITEKPSYSFFVNAGIYALRSSVLERIPRGVFYDMPTLFNDLKTDGKKVCVFPLHEQWRDIGNLEDFRKAQAEEETPS